MHGGTRTTVGTVNPFPSVEEVFANLVQAEVDGERLSNHTIASFFVLLSVAATDTTMNATTLTLRSLTEFPEQRTWLIGGLRGTHRHRRQRVRPLRHAEIFTDPYRFDLSRNPNPHLGFGGGGRHMCLGNQLAKSMLRAIWRELLTRVPDIHSVGEPVLLGTNFVCGVKSLTAHFTPDAR